MTKHKSPAVALSAVSKKHKSPAVALSALLRVLPAPDGSSIAYACKHMASRVHESQYKWNPRWRYVQRMGNDGVLLCGRCVRKVNVGFSMRRALTAEERAELRAERAAAEAAGRDWDPVKRL